MGSESRMLAQLAAKGITGDRARDIAHAVNVLASAGDQLFDAIWPWLDEGAALTTALFAIDSELSKLTAARMTLVALGDTRDF